MGGDATEFLDNLRDYERRVHYGMHWSPFSLPMQKNKAHVQELVFRINCAPALFGADVNKSGVSEVDASEVLPNLEHLSEGVGYVVHELRKKNVSDERIYDKLVESRDSYLEERGICAADFASRRMSIQVYDATNKGLKDFYSEVEN